MTFLSIILLCFVSFADGWHNPGLIGFVKPTSDWADPFNNIYATVSMQNDVGPECSGANTSYTAISNRFDNRPSKPGIIASTIAKTRNGITGFPIPGLTLKMYISGCEGNYGRIYSLLITRD